MIRFIGFVPAALVLMNCASVSLAGVVAVPEPYSLGTVPQSQQSKRLYIVQFEEPPALAAPRQLRSAQGLAASEPRPRNIAADDDTARRYAHKLRSRQQSVLASAQLLDSQVYSYTYTFNGVALRLTPLEAKQLQLHRGVSKVWPDRKRRVATSDSPAFLGLLDGGAGLRSAHGLSGEDVIIGVIDSGIAPGHPSLSDRNQAKKKPRLCRSEWAENTLLGLWLCSRYKDRGNLMYSAPPERWTGTCETGDGFTASDCNNKLIGARYYQDGFDIDTEIDDDEFVSPADADGHGTHIATIAAGNSVRADIYGRDAGQISGIAPRARLAVYKACWLEPGASRATCSMADLQKAIEDAVADGVDIINYSIGDLNDSIDDPDDLALLAAAEAGVLSVVSTGNDGPGAFSIQSPGTTPWVISVGATSRDGQRLARAIRITAPESLAGDYESREAGFTPRLDTTGPLTASLVLADDGNAQAADGSDGTAFDACTTIGNSGELQGNVALIQRGACNFDQKITNVQAAGAVGAVVFNNDGELIVMDGSPVGVAIPAVLIGQADGQLLRDKLQAGDTLAITLDASVFISFTDDGNTLGSYSGRGPSLGDSDFLKPDVVAPGTAILAGQTPDVANGFRGEHFQYLSGTSQAAPHVAGVAALLREAHPDWSPAEIKSALMTASRQDIVKEDGRRPADPFDIGAGHIAPNDSINPGLLYNVDTREYDAYLCTVGLQRGTQGDCDTLRAEGFTQDARDINLPSVAVTELAGRTTLSRTVTNAGPAAVYVAETEAPEGITLEIEPQRLELGENESAQFSLTFTSDGTNLNQWHFGNFRWVSEQHNVYSPFVVQPTQFSAPYARSGEGADGTLSLPVAFGYNGNYSVQTSGLFLPCILPDSDPTDSQCTNDGVAEVADDPGNQYVYLDDPEEWVRRFFIRVPQQDDLLLRVALYDELTNGNDDLDIYLYYCHNLGLQGTCQEPERELVASGVEPNTSNELVEVLNPSSGTWIIDVHGYNTDPNNNGRANFRLYSWAFGRNADAGNLKLTGLPSAAEAGQTANISLGWQSLPKGRWLGGVSHLGSNGAALGMTIVEVESP